MKFVLGILVIAALIQFAFLLIASRVIVDHRPLIYDTNDYMVPRFKSSTWWQYREFDPEKKWDVVILGSSHAYRGYDPAIFQARGYGAFNLGTSSQTPLNTYQIAGYYLNSIHTPVVILDLYDVMFTQDGLESTMDLLQNLENDRVVVGMAWASTDLRSLNMLALRLSQPDASPPKRPPHYAGSGFTPDPDTVVYRAGTETGGRILEPSQKKAFESLVALCLKRNIRLILCSHQKRTAMGTTLHDGFSDYIESVISGTDVPYIDYYNSTLLKDPENFSMGSHLNSAGARIFTEQLVDTLETLGILKRHLR